MNAEPLPSPAVTLPDFRLIVTDHGVVADYRANPKGTPYLHNGRYFDDFTHAMRAERWWFGGVGLRTRAESEESERAARLACVERTQPWGEDGATP